MLVSLAACVLSTGALSGGATPRASLSRRALLSTPLVLGAPLAASAKPFIDERFVLDIPDGYVVSNRKATTGTLFVAGNFPRASVVSVTAWRLQELINEDAKLQELPGIPAEAPPQVSGTALKEIGSSAEAARLLLRARDRESSSGALSSELLDSSFSADGGRLVLSSDTELPVKDPDALFEQRGVRQLIRRTNAAAMLGTVPAGSGAPVPAVFCIWASALVEDWEADLKAPLQQAVESFRVQSAMAPA